MINVYVDSVKLPDKEYVEDEWSAYEIRTMCLPVFKAYIKELVSKGDIHTCHEAFINHIGRFVRESGVDCFDDELHIFVPKDMTNPQELGYEKVFFDENGQLKNWPYGIFG